MHVNLDPQLVDKIANEVKSQGVFDQFRKDSMADVDTKPAYQNLRQRVENTVNKFLSEQTWTPDLNKNQLREKLRKHITEAGFLDVGVERIVDQVVNPKIATVFQPKIEDIAYKYLGIPKPQPKTEVTNGPALNGVLQIETDLMPTDLEQVSPDSDKATVKSDSKDDMETDDKLDDFESPPFEPIEAITNDQSKLDNIDEKEEKPEIADIVAQALKSECETDKEKSLTEDFDTKVKVEALTPPKVEEYAEANQLSAEVSQESQLSQVSSDSHLSIVTNNNTQDEQSTAHDIKEESNVNISEEAQMPKFNENSNSSSEKKILEPLHFDINKDEIKFEGTERKLEHSTEALSPNTSDEQRVDSLMENKTADSSQYSDIPMPTLDYTYDKETDFKFCKIEVKVEEEEPTKASLDDSADKELHIIEKSEMSQCSVTQHSITPPAAKQEKLLKSPSATCSPLQPQKSSHEHSSSRHKKHSRDKRSERDRDRDRHSSSGHKTSSSSSSKHYSSRVSSSSHRAGGSSSDHHHHRDRSSGQKAKHSSRSDKSSRSHHDCKDNSRDHSKSRSDKSKDKSSKDRSDRIKTVDDHYSSKQKWRKSTDSNDDDSSQEGSRNLKNNSNSRENTTNGTLINSNASSATSANNTVAPAAGSTAALSTTSAIGQKIVILDNLLGNPSTNFIEIGSSQVQIISNDKPDATLYSHNPENLYYFEEDADIKLNVACRIRLLTNIMDNFRKILQNSLDFPRKQSTTDSEMSPSLEMNRPESISPSECSRKRNFESPSLPPALTSATLTIDCIQYETASNSHCLSKRYKFDRSSVTKVSPTPSELSVNSKENEFIDKNQLNGESFESQVKNSTSISGKRKDILSRNQRYSSEDLYKPRPILSQRSRRRGLDAII